MRCREMSPGGHSCFVCFIYPGHALKNRARQCSSSPAESLMLKHQILYCPRVAVRQRSLTFQRNCFQCNSEAEWRDDGESVQIKIEPTLSENLWAAAGLIATASR